jgi:hypothetical protein
LIAATRSGERWPALRWNLMRRFLPAFVALGLGLAFLAGRADALNAEEEEIEAEETLPSYAGTQLPVDDHDPTQAAHPLRIVAYAVHPVGVALDWILVRPAVWVVRREPFKTIFGYED